MTRRRLRAAFRPTQVFPPLGCAGSPLPKSTLDIYMSGGTAINGPRELSGRSPSESYPEARWTKDPPELGVHVKAEPHRLPIRHHAALPLHPGLASVLRSASPGRWSRCWPDSSSTPDDESGQRGAPAPSPMHTQCAARTAWSRPHRSEDLTTRKARRDAWPSPRAPVHPHLGSAC